MIDEIERSQDLFKLAKPAFWGGFRVFYESSSLKFLLHPQIHELPVVLSFFPCLSLGVRTKIGTVYMKLFRQGSNQDLDN